MGLKKGHASIAINAQPAEITIISKIKVTYGDYEIQKNFMSKRWGE